MRLKSLARGSRNDSTAKDLFPEWLKTPISPGQPRPLADIWIANVRNQCAILQRESEFFDSEIALGQIPEQSSKPSLCRLEIFAGA